MTTFNRADEIEKLVKGFAVLLLILAALFLSNAIETLFEDTVEAYIEFIKVPLAIVIVAIATSVVWRGLQIKRNGGSYDMFEEGGYMGAMFQKAAAKAFMITYAITVFLATLNNKVLSHLTAENLAYIVLTYSLTAFSIVFFILTRGSGDEGSEDGE